MTKLALPKNFNEHSYLDINPDVAAAVRAGHFESGAAHFLQYGFKESRRLSRHPRPAPLRRPFAQGAKPTRRDYILADLDLEKMEGMEIGALAAPLVQKDEGNILYIDHADTETLKKKYADDPSVSLDNIVHVDAIWGENTLQDCIGSDRKLDYIVASHVIEHVPDLITWLNEIAQVLKPNGTLRLAIPDKRYTFDILRNETYLHDVLDAYIRRSRIPSPRMILEHHNLVRHVNCSAAWQGSLDLSQINKASSLENGIAAATDAFENRTYHDVHCWIFTPHSFEILCKELSNLDLIKLKILNIDPTIDNNFEFFVTMNGGQ